MKNTHTHEGGYIAIMTTILITLVLLSLVAENGFVGWHARFVTLSREKKQQADALAHGCITAALSAATKDPHFSSSTLSFPLGTCHMRLVDASTPRTAELRIQGVSGDADTGGAAYTNMKVIADFGDIHLGSSTLNSGPNPAILSVTILSEQETPNE